VVTNPRVNMCKTGGLCSLRLTLKGPVLNLALDVWAKYDNSRDYFLLYGDQYKFKASIDSHVHRSVNLSNSNVNTQAALGVTINSQDEFWNTYVTAKAEFVAPNESPDLTYLYRLKPNDCYPNKPGSFYYDGMPGRWHFAVLAWTDVRYQQ